MTSAANPPTVAVHKMLPFVRIWIWFSALAALTGWTLSAFGQLNRPGYGVAFIVGIFFIFFRRKDLDFAQAIKFLRGNKWLRRFRRLLPLSFGALAFLIFLSGAIHAPDNYTGLDYRIARALQWLAHGSWHWIHTSIYRMNDRACGIEWMSAPLLLFTHSTRGLFLLNFIPFLLLPGLIFSLFTRLGVRARVAWQWMWLLPTGYIFLLQAGSIANDAFPTVYGLAAIDFALRVRKSNRFFDFSLSTLAAALMTGAKASNLPLLLPWIILIIPAARLVREKFTVTALIVILAAIVSFLPTAILNFIYCGDWSGAVLEPTNMTVKNPLIAIAGNLFQFLLQNFCPPFFPFAGWWNSHAPQFMPHVLIFISSHFDTGFFQLGELPTEDWAGIGFGLSALLTITVGAKITARSTRFKIASAFPLSTLRFFILLSPWLALLAYSAESGMTTASRLIAPYYPLLLPLLLVGNTPAQIVRRRWWNVLVVAHLALAFFVLVLTPDRPLWPAQTILSKLTAKHPNSHSLERAQRVYSVYAHRADPLADVRKLLPGNVRTVGFIGNADDCDISLWLPLGSRRVEHFLLSDSPETIRHHGIQYVVIGGFNLSQNQMTIDDWLKKSDAELAGSATATLKVGEGPQKWFLARMK